MKLIFWIVIAFLLNAIIALGFMFFPSLLTKVPKLSKDKRGAIIFCLYALWHGLIIDVLVSSTESKFKLIASAIGLLIVDLYLFFNHYNKSQKD